MTPGLRTVARAALAAGAALSLVPGGAAASPSPPLRVFAAASLGDAFREIGAAFEATHPGIRVELECGGSAQLRVQIEQGAPADVFAAADLETVESLERAGRTDRARTFATNRLVVVTPARAAGVATLAGLGRRGVRLALAGPSVPAGRYAASAIAAMDRSRRYGPRFAARVRANIVSEETSVRAALTRVALGEADAAFVYATDAASAASRVRVIAIPDSLAPPVCYGIARVLGSSRHPAAPAFVAFVTGPAGGAILRRFGFGA